MGRKTCNACTWFCAPNLGRGPSKKNRTPRSGKEGAADQTNKELDEDPAAGGGHGSQQVNVEKQPLLRFIVMGRKSLPDPTKRSTPYWGFIEMVTTNIQHVKAALKGEEYETATRGHRHRPDCRAAGEGIYRIPRHNPGSGSSKMHTHLVYKLEYPPQGAEEEPQGALNIALNLQGLLGKPRLHPADPPDFLNYEGCEFLLISASDDIEEELGLELKTEQPQDGSPGAECSDLIKTFGETAASTRPLFQGTWD